jgi:hypothetical protein
MRQCRRSRRRNAPLAGLAAEIDLQTNRQRWQGRWSLFGKALRNSQLIDGMYPVESLGNPARLVGLQRTDEMPFKPQRPKLVDLCRPS